MSSPQLNSPLAVAPHAASTVDPETIRERVAELQRKTAYALQNFAIWRRVIGDNASFNASLTQLRRALKATGSVVLPELHIELKFAVTYLAREHATANGRSGPLCDADLGEGAREAVGRLKAKRGRPTWRVLRLHVEGFMALVEETVGARAAAVREKNSVYDPQVTNWSGQYIVDQLQKADPSIAESTIARMILDARKQYAGKPMRFVDFFEGYGMRIVPH